MSYAAPFVWNGGASNTGLTLTAKVLDSSLSTIASGLSGVTEIGSTGIYVWYYASFSDDFVGFVEFLSGSTVKAVMEISPADAANLLTAARAAKLDLLGGAVIVSSAPVVDNDLITLVRGDDYSSSDSRALDWTNEDGTWPNLTSATISFTMRPATGYRGASVPITGSVVTPTGAGQKVRAQLTAAETAGLIVGPKAYRYDVQATLATNGRKITLAYGFVTVVEDAT